jgi:hypothetical protein
MNSLQGINQPGLPHLLPDKAPGTIRLSMPLFSEVDYTPLKTNLYRTVERCRLSNLARTLTIKHFSNQSLLLFMSTLFLAHQKVLNEESIMVALTWAMPRVHWKAHSRM